MLARARPRPPPVRPVNRRPPAPIPFRIPTIRRAPRAPPRLVARLCQRDHAAPELLTLAGVDVVLAHERESSVAGDAIDHDAGGQRLDRVAVAHRERPDARRHEQLPARVDAEGSQMNAVAFDGLDEARLPGLCIDGEHGNVVLAAVEDLLAFELDLALVA